MPSLRRFCAASLLLLTSTLGAADTVGIFAVASRVHDPAAPVPTAIGRDGTVDTAAVVRDAGGTGMLDLTTWSGDTQAGGRGVGGLNLRLAPGQRAYVGVDRAWALDAYAPVLDGWVGYATYQQDALLTCGFAATDAAAVVRTPGDGWSLDGVQPSDRVILTLPWRWVQGGGSAWQTGSYRGNPPEAGLWAVPAGMSLAQAQAAPATWQLAGFDGTLAQIQPHLRSLAFRLRLTGGGGWQVAMDIDADGTADVVTDHRQDGHKPSPFIDLDERSGLLASFRGAMGARTGTVIRSRIGLTWRVADQDEPAVIDRRPFTVAIPETSLSSPILVPGTAWSPTRAITATGPTIPGGSEVVALTPGSTAWYHPLHLDPAGPTPVTYGQSGTGAATTHQGTVRWLPIDLEQHPTVAVRSGSTVKLLWGPDYEPGTPVDLDLDGNGSIDRRAISGAEIPVTYGRPGTYRVTAWVEGQPVGAATIAAVAVNFDGPIACEVGYKRDKGVEIAADLRDRVVFVAADRQALEVSVKEKTPYGVRLFLKPLADGRPVVVARLDSATGPILASQAIDAFRLTDTARDALLVGYEGYAWATLRMTPWVPGMDLVQEMFAGTGSFDGMAKSNVIPPSEWEVAWDPAVSATVGTLHRRIWVSPMGNTCCLSARMDQHSKYGTPTSLGSAGNSVIYWANAEKYPAVVSFKVGEAAQTYPVTFWIESRKNNTVIKNPSEVTWEYGLRHTGHRGPTTYPNLVGGEMSKSSPDYSLKKGISYPKDEERKSYPEQGNALAPGKFGNAFMEYRIGYHGRLSKSKNERPVPLSATDATKVVMSSIDISTTRDYIVVPYAETGATKPVAGVDTIAITVDLGEANPDSWKFIDPIPGDLELTDKTEKGATVRAKNDSATPGGPYTIEVASKKLAEEKRTLTIGVGSASWKPLEKDNEKQIVMSPGGQGENWIVLTPTTTTYKHTLRTKGSKAVFTIKSGDTGKLKADPVSVTAQKDTAINISEGTENIHDSRAFSISAADVAYPSSDKELVAVRKYNSSTRTVKMISVYFSDKDGKKVYYATGTSTRPTYDTEGTDLPFVQQMGYNFSVTESIDFKFMDARDSYLSSGGVRKFVWNSTLRLALSSSAATIIGSVDHRFFLVGRVDQNPNVAARAEEPGNKIWGADEPWAGIIAHEIGHNLNTQGADNEGHTPDTFMQAKLDKANWNADTRQVNSARPIKSTK